MNKFFSNGVSVLKNTTQIKSPFNFKSLPEEFDFILSNFNSEFMDKKRILLDFDYELSLNLKSAFENENPIAMLEIHKIIFKIYGLVFPIAKMSIYSYKYYQWLLKIKDKIEKKWFEYEFNHIQEYLPDQTISRHSESLCDWFLEKSKEETSIDKKIINYLRHQISIDKLNFFLMSDAPLNNQFLSFLKLARTDLRKQLFEKIPILHDYLSEIPIQKKSGNSSFIKYLGVTSDEFGVGQKKKADFQSAFNTIKTEIDDNILDECGRGMFSKTHAQQFSHMLVKMGLAQTSTPIWEDWRPYAGFNLHFCLGLNRKQYYFESLGSLAMPELFDPDRNRAVVQGLERLYSNPRLKFEYFYNHIEVDEDHGTGWLNNVISPIVRLKPSLGIHLAIGGALRMAAMRRYNEYLAVNFGLK